MRILAKNKIDKYDKIRISTSFAFLPKKCFDTESMLEFYVWLEPIKIVYTIKNNKWVKDHYLTYALTKY